MRKLVLLDKILCYLCHLFVVIEDLCPSPIVLTAIIQFGLLSMSFHMKFYPAMAVILKPLLETPYKPSALHYLAFRAGLKQAGKIRVATLWEILFLKNQNFTYEQKLHSFKLSQRRGRGTTFGITKIFWQFQNNIMPRSWVISSFRAKSLESLEA